MSCSDDFFNFLQDQLISWSVIDTKRMFGVIGLYSNGVMFGILSKNVVYLKVDDSNKKKFILAGSKPLRVFKNNSEVPSYFDVPVDVLEDSEKLIEWAQESYFIQVNRRK